MTASPRAAARHAAPREVRLDRLLGRSVLGPNNQPVGRLEEFRTTERGSQNEIVGYVIGGAGLLERLGVAVRLVLGLRIGGYLARWDQIDISDPQQPRLTCRPAELQKL